MTKCGIIYDEMGYSTKIAKIEFQNKESAKAAKEELDGMNIFIILFFRG